MDNIISVRLTGDLSHGLFAGKIESNQEDGESKFVIEHITEIVYDVFTKVCKESEEDCPDFSFQITFENNEEAAEDADQYYSNIESPTLFEDDLKGFLKLIANCNLDPKGQIAVEKMIQRTNEVFGCD